MAFVSDLDNRSEGFVYFDDMTLSVQSTACFWNSKKNLRIEYKLVIVQGNFVFGIGLSRWGVYYQFHLRLNLGEVFFGRSSLPQFNGKQQRWLGRDKSSMQNMFQMFAQEYVTYCPWRLCCM